VRDKIELTRQLVEKLPPGAWTVDQARITWWYNFRESGGMRLTKHGYDAFVKELEIEFYEFDIPVKSRFNQKTILELDRRLQMPYYIKVEKQRVAKLIFFSSQEAVLVNLYGDLEKFLNNYN
jgi:hypothetical protein